MPSQAGNPLIRIEGYTIISVLARHRERLMNKLLVIACSLLCAATARPDGPQVLDVWPGKAPGENGKIGDEKVLDAKPGEARKVQRITNVTRPTLSVFRPAKDKDTGAA